jgi:membrane protein implicated in regulation of membrane protease activity
VSIAEDVVAGGLTLVSLLMPVLAAALMLVLIIALATLFRRFLRRRQPSRHTPVHPSQRRRGFQPAMFRKDDPCAEEPASAVEPR